MKAINDKVFQEQQRLVAENRLKTVEAEQKSNVAIATASAESVKAKADGDAYAIKANADATAYDKLANATAEAKSLQLQNQAIASSKDVLELRRIEVELVKAHNWKGEFPQNMYGSVPLPFMNVTPGH
jgi:hypothetical protein